jgi:menaquinol-cytochrome c reductase iron-sulfur subunit
VPDKPSRRRFGHRLLLWATAVIGAFAALAFAFPVVGYFLGPLKRKASPWVKLGPVDKFPMNETRMATFDNPLRQPWDGMTSNTGVYVRNLGPVGDGKEKFLIFAVNCAHLGCPVEWFPQSGLFMCPCHGGVYYENGERASGPPPRGLYQCEWRIHDGHLEVEAPFYPTLQNTLKTGRA